MERIINSLKKIGKVGKSVIVKSAKIEETREALERLDNTEVVMLDSQSLDFAPNEKEFFAKLKNCIQAGKTLIVNNFECLQYGSMISILSAFDDRKILRIGKEEFNVTANGFMMIAIINPSAKLEEAILDRFFVLQ